MFSQSAGEVPSDPDVTFPMVEAAQYINGDHG